MKAIDKIMLVLNQLFQPNETPEEIRFSTAGGIAKLSVPNHVSLKDVYIPGIQDVVMRETSVEIIMY